MKRQIQKTGVRKFFGQDFVDLQAEPLKALDAFFAEYGACLIEGCAITEADGGTFNVAPGLVALESTDPESGAVAIRTMPFAGAQGVALPLYLVAEWTVVERAYGDGKVKPIGYNLRAVASGIAPEGAHLTLTAAGGNRFVDAVQDGTHRFIADAERTKWNDVLRQAKEYAVAQAQAEAAASQTTAVGLAKAHTEGQVAAVRDELALGDQAAINTAKAYADRIVAALVDNSPELLNTLEELAAALGNNPDFATTVMTEIGKRATMSQVNTALAGKFDKGGGELAGDVALVANDELGGRWIKQRIAGYDTVGLHFNRSIAEGVYSQLDIYTRGADGFVKRATINQGGLSIGGHLAYHKGNLPAVIDAIEIGGVNLVSERNWSDNGAYYTQNIAVTPGKSYIHSGNCGITGWKTPSGQFVYGNPVVAPAGVSSLVVHVGREVAIGLVRVMVEQATKPSAYQPAFSDLIPKIIRGSADARGGNGGGNAEGIFSVPGEQAVVRVTHNLGTTAYSATASAVSNTNNLHTDNVVSAWRKTANYVDFVVSAGADTARELCAFDFMIIPY